MYFRYLSGAASMVLLTALGCKQQAVERSRFATLDHKPHIIKAHADRIGTYRNGWEIWRHSDVIVLGRVVGIDRVRVYPEDWTPGLPSDDPRSSMFRGFGTTFLVQVERYIKGKGPSTIKVFQRGGVIEDTVYVESDNPLLVSGERYILSLDDARLTEGESGMMYSTSRAKGFIYGEVGGNPIRVAELDELFFSDWEKGKIHVRADGITEPVADPYVGGIVWTGGKDLIGVPVASAISAIEAGKTYRMPGEYNPYEP